MSADPATSVPPAVYPEDQQDLANDAACRREARLADRLRGFVTRWETLDFGISGNCVELDDRFMIWQGIDAADTPNN